MTDRTPYLYRRLRFGAIAGAVRTTLPRAA